MGTSNEALWNQQLRMLRQLCENGYGYQSGFNKKEEVIGLFGFDVDCGGWFLFEYVTVEQPVYYVDYESPDYAVEDADS